MTERILRMWDDDDGLHIVLEDEEGRVWQYDGCVITGRSTEFAHTGSVYEVEVRPVTFTSPLDGHARS